jgi:hypothetical protein
VSLAFDRGLCDCVDAVRVTLCDCAPGVHTTAQVLHLVQSALGQVRAPSAVPWALCVLDRKGVWVCHLLVVCLLICARALFALCCFRVGAGGP